MGWPEGRGLTTVVNVGRPGALPWAAREQDTSLVLKQELRLEILQLIPLRG